MCIRDRRIPYAARTGAGSRRCSADPHVVPPTTRRSLVRTTWIKLLALLALLTLFGTACTADDEGAQTEAGGDAGAATASAGATGDAGTDVAQGGGGGGLLGEVQSRGTLRCGVNDTV